jgi:hypothetical protein
MLDGQALAFCLFLVNIHKYVSYSKIFGLDVSTVKYTLRHEYAFILFIKYSNTFLVT